VAAPIISFVATWSRLLHRPGRQALVLQVGGHGEHCSRVISGAGNNRSVGPAGSLWLCRYTDARQFVTRAAAGVEPPLRSSPVVLFSLAYAVIRLVLEALRRSSL
jgi:hypothetical protein